MKHEHYPIRQPYQISNNNVSRTFGVKAALSHNTYSTNATVQLVQELSIATMQT